MQEQDKAVGEHNPFTKMGMSQVLGDFNHCLSDFSGLAYCQLYRLWPLLTKQLITALLQDFLQTLLVAIVVLIVLIWVTVHYLGPTLAGWFGG